MAEVLDGEVMEPGDESAELAGGEAGGLVTVGEVRVPALDALPLKMRVFVNRYLSNGFKPGEAARAAGWGNTSAPGAASRLLRRPDVIRAIEACMESQGLARVKVLEGLGSLAHSDLTDVVTWGEDGVPKFKASGDLPSHVRGAITKIKVDPESGRITEIEMGSKVTALTAMVKGLRMDRPAVEVNAAGPVQVVISGEDAAVL